MSKSFWNQEEEFRDGAPEFSNGEWKEVETYTPGPVINNVVKTNNRQIIQKPAAQIEITEASVSDSEDHEEDYTEVLYDARSRLEQGRLYEMIMNHSLFEGVEVDPRAAKIVQSQIRRWAKEQIEIMLGMRQVHETPTGIVSSPFNNLEVEVLKSLASAASKGATESEEAQNEAPLPPAPKKKTTLNSIGSSKVQEKVAPKPLQKKAEPIKREAQPKQFLQTQSATQSKLEEDYEPLKKPLHEMTTAELEERNRQASERQRSKTAALPPDRMAMPDYATKEMLAMQQVSKATAGGGLSGFNGRLSSLIVNNGIKKV